MTIRNEHGFTLPELIIVMTVTTVLVGVVMLFTFSYWQYSFVSQANQQTFTDRLNASDYLRENLGSSSGLITQTSIPDNNTGAPDPGDNQFWASIHAVPGNITHGSSDITPISYFKKPSLNNTGQIIMNGSAPFEDEYVLYLHKPTRTLKVRTLANANAPNNRAVTSCPLSTASATCPEDRTLSENIDSVDKRFFSRSGVVIDWTSVYDSNIGQYIGPDNPTVEVVEFTLNISTKPIFQKSKTVSSSTVVRVALRNI
jgi:prepilin-type N-terminal cleavage/methylation domain-containing protein